MNPHRRAIEELYAHLHSGADGLSQAEAGLRLARYGANQIEEIAAQPAAEGRGGKIPDVVGQRAQVADHYAKYITVQGIKTPMHLARQRNGLRTFEAHLTEVQYNAPLLDNLFTRASLEERWQKVK